MGHASVQVVDFEDRHVTAVAPHFFEQAAGGRAVRDGRDDLEELVSDSEERIVQSEFGDTRVAEAHVDVEMPFDIGDRRIEVACDEGNLTQGDHEDTVNRFQENRKLLFFSFG
ncbi:MAG: hypothetical protein RLZZ199_988 [Actinomycetota bacterium]